MGIAAWATFNLMPAFQTRAGQMRVQLQTVHLVQTPQSWTVSKVCRWGAEYFRVGWEALI